MKERLNEIINYLRYHNDIKSQKDFAEKIEMQPTHLSAALKGDAKRLTKGLVDKIVKAFPVISPDWLLNGHGEMAIPSPADTAIARLSAEVASLSAENARLRSEVASLSAENARLRTELTRLTPDGGSRVLPDTPDLPLVALNPDTAPDTLA